MGMVVDLEFMRCMWVLSWKIPNITISLDNTPHASTLSTRFVLAQRFLSAPFFANRKEELMDGLLRPRFSDEYGVFVLLGFSP